MHRHHRPRCAGRAATGGLTSVLASWAILRKEPACAFIAGRASAIIDLDGGGHAGRKDDAGRHLIDMDADRDALGQAHPGKMG